MSAAEDGPLRLEGSVDAEHAGLRLDVYVSRHLAGCSRSGLSSRLETIRINGSDSRLSRKVEAGDRVLCVLRAPDAAGDVAAENINLEVLFENDHVIVLDKACGMVVHPANGNWSGTLVGALLYRYPQLAERFGSRERPGIVHRLDKETSGVMIVARHPEAHAHLSAQFAARRTRKRYIAVVKGAPPESEGKIESFIRRDPKHRKRFAVSKSEGKRAETSWRILARLDRVSLVALSPRTGRTHQLRVHMQHLGCPVLGDQVYARGKVLEQGMLLHAASLSIVLPQEREQRTFTTRFPERFRSVISTHGGPESGEDPGWFEVLREW